MKVVFLDVDGVLNSGEYLQRLKGFRTTRLDELIDPAAVARLNRITQLSGASIVVSSSWRYGYLHDIEGLREMLRRNGVLADVLGITPVMGVRGQEIKSWLMEHSDVDDYVIIDDNDDEAMKPVHVVKTSYAKGLQDEHVALALKALCVYTG